MAVFNPDDLPVADLFEYMADGDTAALVQLALGTIQRVTGLESSYLTFIDWTEGTQSIVQSMNTGDLDISEGAVIPWGDTLCRRALLSGVEATADADATFGVNNAGHGLGIVSYVSVPVLTQDRGIYGTLCAASTRSREVDADALELLRLFAHLLGRQVDSDQLIERERERAERAVQRTRARLMMVAESEHRVKTPLTVIRGVAALLAERWTDLDDERRLEMIASIVRQSDDLVDCIQVLLAQGREEMEELAVSRVALFVAPVLEQVATDHGLGACDHTIEVSCEGSVVARVDAVSLQQMLGHLIDNSIKYTPSGGLISVEGRNEGDRAILTVSDDGPGLPEGLDPFAVFGRGPDAEQQATGTGLGLYIVRSIAARLGGHVSAGSGPGVGAAFVIDLPGG